MPKKQKESVQSSSDESEQEYGSEYDDEEVESGAEMREANINNVLNYESDDSSD